MGHLGCRAVILLVVSFFYAERRLPFYVDLSGGFTYNPHPDKGPTVLMIPFGTVEQSGEITFPIRLVNLSDKLRASVTFEAFAINAKSGFPNWTVGGGNGGIKNKGVKTDLGPGETAEGMLSVFIEPSYYEHVPAERMTLSVFETISGARATITLGETFRG